MNSIKFIMALVAVCMLVMPAFSMLDNGMGHDCKQEMSDCLKSPMGYDGEHIWQGQDGEQKSCDCQKSMMGDKDDNEGVKIVIINLDV